MRPPRRTKISTLHQQAGRNAVVDMFGDGMGGHIIERILVALIKLHATMFHRVQITIQLVQPNCAG